MPAPSDASVRRWAPVPFVVVLLAYGAQLAVQATEGNTSGALGAVAFTVMIVLFPLTGWLILRRRPGNRIGLLLGAIGLTWAVVPLSVVYTYLAGRYGLPGGDAVSVVGSAFWPPPVLMTTFFLILLFPDGRVPSPRWRIVARIVAADAVLLPFCFALGPGSVETDGGTIPVNPLGWQAGRTLLIVLVAVGLPLVPVSVLAAATNLVLRFRRSTGVDRLQLKWLMSAGAAVAVVYGAVLGLSLVYVRNTPGWVEKLQGPSALVFTLIPIAIGVAITRHGLYGIDTLISRALTVAVLGALVTGVYVAIVVGLSRAIGDRHPSVWLSVLATALVAVAFQPVRGRVQHGVNRVVYGRRATPYEVLSDFATRLTGRYTTGELLPRLARLVAESLGSGQVEVWLRVGSNLVCEAGFPVGAARGPDVVAAGTRLAADLVVPVRHRDELLGVLAVTKHAHEPVTPAEQAMIAQVASQAGLVLRNLGLVEDLQRSRRRLVTSQDDERRRLERDLHDGAQQSLVSVAIMLQIAASQTDRQAALDGVAAASGQLSSAIAELRELAHGIHPAILTERGLAPAVSSLAARSAVAITLETALDRRLPPTVESALYFVVAEALTNVAKYAGASRATLTLRDDGDSVTVCVQDDGVGGADAANGTGLLGLSDRLAVVDGVLELDSPPDAGTRLWCRVPV